jgi:multicomponent Na+:H+ antiporter subunit E
MVSWGKTKGRTMHNIPVVILLTVFYLAITANLEPINIVAGVLIAVGLVAMLRPPKRAFRWHRLPSAVAALSRYVAILLRDMLYSGFQAAGIVLHPKLPLNTGIIKIPTECKSSLGAALSAHAITLTPGELVIAMTTDGTLYTHCLDVRKSGEHVERAQKLREELLRQISA